MLSRVDHFLLFFKHPPLGLRGTALSCFSLALLPLSSQSPLLNFSTLGYLRDWLVLASLLWCYNLSFDDPGLRVINIFHVTMTHKVTSPAQPSPLIGTTNIICWKPSSEFPSLQLFLMFYAKVNTIRVKDRNIKLKLLKYKKEYIETYIWEIYYNKCHKAQET